MRRRFVAERAPGYPRRPPVPMVRPSPRWYLSLLAMLCVPVLVSTGKRLMASSAEPAEPDQVRFVRQLAPLRQRLTGVASVGFVCDHPPESPPLYGFPHPHSQEYEGLVRLVLVPTMVVAGTEQELVVGVFADVALGLAAAAERGLHLQQQFEGGIVLLARRAR